ncbi:MAG: STAS domain-containing protein [Desulfobacteraceae bacterium]|nr:STAS domain-containing protein [Desulfobacteraceae bacterium]
MEIIEEKKDEIHVFKLNGRLDSNTSPDFEESIFQAIDGGTRRIVVDCGQLEYITSAGLRVLNKTAKRLKPDEGKVVLCAMEDYVREVFEIAGFDTFLPIVSGLDEALARAKE